MKREIKHDITSFTNPPAQHSISMLNPPACGTKCATNRGGPSFAVDN